MSLRQFDPNEADQEQQYAVIDNSNISKIESAQIDMQVATAKKYPRSIKKFLAEAEKMVTINEDVAMDCFYKLKRNGPDGVKFIEGPSVRLLEIAASCYENIYYGAIPMGEDGDFTSSQGVAWDLEKNVRSSLTVRRRITTKTGSRFGADMIAVTSNAASSIAKRNALNGIVPRVYVDRLMALAKQVAIGEAKPLEELRSKMIQEFSKMGVSKEQIVIWLDVKEVEDINRDHILDLRGAYTAIKSGESTIEEEFPPIKNPAANTPSFTGPPKSSETAKEAKVKPPVAKEEQKKPADPKPVAPVEAVETKQVDPSSAAKTDVPAEDPLSPLKGLDPKNEKHMELAQLMMRDGVTEEALEAWSKNRKPPIFAMGGKATKLTDLSNAKLDVICSLWDDEVKGKI